VRFDATASRRLLASYRTPDIVAQRQAVLAALAPRPGERILDVGSGPGLLAAELAAAVGPNGSVAGIDPSEDMLALAARLHAENTERPTSAASITFDAATATGLPHPDAGFDAVVSTQVYEYVEDMPLALAEARRVLRPGGRLVILDTDWDSLVWRHSDDALHRRVMSVWDQHLADPFLPRRLPQLLHDAGFELTSHDVLVLANVGYERNTFSAWLIEMVTSFATDRDGLTQAEAAAWAAGLIGLGEGYFFSLNRYLFAARRPGA
jgi:ubiquinone/menaquinone biosynthesis C-methylase UbiE